jgi:vanillate/3-O-methylgallate O-demethylase
MNDKSLQSAIDQAGSPVSLWWKPNSKPWSPPGVASEFTGWRGEQAAAYETAALSDLSYHIPYLFIEGPGALPLLRDYVVNDLDNFVMHQAKQVVAVNAGGQFVGDGILTRDGDEKFTLSAVPYIESWLQYHGETGDYGVRFEVVPDASLRNGADPRLFRYQVQGPNALELVDRVFGGPLPRTKFFHSTPVELQGRTFRALRHGMTGQPGYEFFGDWADHDVILNALLEHGEDLGLVRVGAMAYSLNGVESGWIPVPTGAIYDSPDLKPCREWVPAMSFEGMAPLKGSFYSPDIADYYATPYDLGYGRLVKFNHDFLGREALERLKDQPARERVTLVFDREDAQAVWGGPEIGFVQSYGRYRVEDGGDLVGIGFYTGSIAHAGTVMNLALINASHATPGTRVTFVWGDHPGAGADPDPSQFTRISATVQPSPYNEFARTGYRANS